MRAALTFNRLGKTWCSGEFLALFAVTLAQAYTLKDDCIWSGIDDGLGIDVDTQLMLR